MRSENNLSERLNTNVATITTKISTKFFYTFKNWCAIPIIYCFKKRCKTLKNLAIENWFSVMPTWSRPIRTRPCRSRDGRHMAASVTREAIKERNRNERFIFRCQKHSGRSGNCSLAHIHRVRGKTFNPIYKRLFYDFFLE